MAVNVTKHVGAGLTWLGWATVDSDGYPVGSGATLTAPSAGDQTGASLAQLTGAKTFPFSPVDPDRPTATGDDGAVARFLFNPIDLPEASAQFSVGDYDLYAAALSTLVHNLGGASFVPVQPDAPTYRDMLFLAVSQAKSQESGTVGSSIYECRLILKTNVFPRHRLSFEERAIGTYEYSMIANYGEKYPWGLAFTNGSNGTTKAAALDFTFPYKPMIQWWTGNNSQTSFNLSQNIAEDSANNIIAYVNGTVQTWVTGAPGAGEFGITEGATDAIVFGTAPAASAHVVVLYGWS